MKGNLGRTFLGRFSAEDDLLHALTNFCQQEDIRLGTFTLIGALNGVSLCYYDQDQHQYISNIHLSEKLEIVSCAGNISLKDNTIFVHAHIVVAARDGRTWGGHLMPGARIFAAEYCIQELLGGELHREYDARTGLSLWKEPGEHSS